MTQMDADEGGRGMRERLGIHVGDGEGIGEHVASTEPDTFGNGTDQFTICNWQFAICSTPAVVPYVEVPPDTPAGTLRDLRTAGYRLVLDLAKAEPETIGATLQALSPEALEGYEVAGWAFRATGDDPMVLNARVAAIAQALGRAPRRLPGWLTKLEVGEGADAPARAVQYAAHALALDVGSVFLAPPWDTPFLEATLQAYQLLGRHLEGARRIAMTARGQYRIEYPDRHNRYLLWEAPGIQRLPSSLQMPLMVTDLTGATRRVEATRLKLTDQPIFADRES